MGNTIPKERPAKSAAKQSRRNPATTSQDDPTTSQDESMSSVTNIIHEEVPIELPEDDYDFVLDVRNVVHASPGWRLTGPSTAKALAELVLHSEKVENWRESVVCFLGHYDAGKTFLLNLLAGVSLPSSTCLETKGLSCKRITTSGDRTFIGLDTAGQHTPIQVSKNTSFTDAIAGRKATEYFLRDVAIHISDQFVIVVKDFSDVDQEYLMNVATQVHSKIYVNYDRKVCEGVLYVIHNFHRANMAECSQLWKLRVQDVFAKVGTGHTSQVFLPGSATPVTVSWFQVVIPGTSLTVKHYCLANNNFGPEEKNYNLCVAHYLKSIIQNYQPDNRSSSPFNWMQAICCEQLKNKLTDFKQLHYAENHVPFISWAIDSLYPSRNEGVSSHIQNYVDKELPGLRCIWTFLAYHNLLKPKEGEANPPDQATALKELVHDYLINNQDKPLYGNEHFKINEFFCSTNMKRETFLTDNSTTPLILYGLAQTLKIKFVIVAGNMNQLITIYPEPELEPVLEAKEPVLEASEVNEEANEEVIDASEEANVPDYPCFYYWCQDSEFIRLRPFTEDDAKLFFTNPAIDSSVVVLKSPKPITLKDYSVNVYNGVQFDLSDTVPTHYSVVSNPEPDGDIGIKLTLEIPGIENFKCKADHRARDVLHFTGIRPRDLDPETRDINFRSTRKYGEYKFTYEIPPTCSYKKKHREIKHNNGVCTITFKSLAAAKKEKKAKAKVL